MGADSIFELTHSANRVVFPVDSGLSCIAVLLEQGLQNSSAATNPILQLVLSTLDDAKGRDIKVIDVRGKTSITDFMVIASGTSERHVQALAEHVVEEAKKNQNQPLGVEGQRSGEWVLVDLGDVILHVMKPQTREFYQLEKFWQNDSANAGSGPTH